MPIILAQVFVIILLILANGVFAMAEIAVVSARKHQLQNKADEGNPNAKTALEMAKNPTRFLSTVQIGITLVGILSGAFGGAVLSGYLAAELAKIPLLSPYSDELALVLVVIAITYLSLVFGELIPKRLGLNNPESIAIVMARPMHTLARITAPIINLLSVSTEVVLRIMGVKQTKDPGATEEDIRILLAQGTKHGLFYTTERELVEAVFRFGDRVVEEVMTPHTEIEWINSEDSLEEITSQILNSSHEQLPVAQGSLDNLQGILITNEFLVQLLSGQPVQLTKMIKPPLIVPQNLPAIRALEAIKKEDTGILIVIDEHSGILGMVTLIDILDAIVGVVPHDGAQSQEHITRRDDGSYLVDGLYPIDQLKDFFSIDFFPDEEEIGYLTLGGLMMSQFGEIPSPGKSFEWQNYRFEVVDMDGMRVDKVLISLESHPQNIINSNSVIE